MLTWLLFSIQRIEEKEEQSELECQLLKVKEYLWLMQMEQQNSQILIKFGQNFNKLLNKLVTH